MINIAQEPLDFRRVDFSSTLSLLMPTFAFPYAPANLAVHLQRIWNVPLPPGITTGAMTSVSGLVPRIVGAGSLD